MLETADLLESAWNTSSYFTLDKSYKCYLLAVEDTKNNNILFETTVFKGLVDVRKHYVYGHDGNTFGYLQKSANGSHVLVSSGMPNTDWFIRLYGVK